MLDPNNAMAQMQCVWLENSSTPPLSNLQYPISNRDYSVDITRDIFPDTTKLPPEKQVFSQAHQFFEMTCVNRF